MALISCPECQREVSDKAVHCVHCGYPLKASESFSKDQLVELGQKPNKPELANDLSVGSRGWFGPSPVKGMFEGFASSDDRITSDSGSISIHEKGVVLSLGFGTTKKIDIHQSQIIDMKLIPNSQVFEEGRSVIGRALVGSLFLGPVGTVVAGMSGISSKKTSEHSIIINYWDVEADMPYSAMLYANDLKKAKGLCDDVQRMAAKYRASIKVEKVQQSIRDAELLKRKLADESYQAKAESAILRVQAYPDEFVVIGGDYATMLEEVYKDLFGSEFRFVLYLKSRKLCFKLSEVGVQIPEDEEFKHYLLGSRSTYRDGICYLRRQNKNISKDDTAMTTSELHELSDVIGACSPELYQAISEICGTDPVNQDEIDYCKRVADAGL